MIKRFSIVLLSILVFYGCSKKPDVEYTPTYKMAGEWFVEYYLNGSAVTDYSKMLTYNTADVSAGQIWVVDTLTGGFKAKLDVDYPVLSFKAMDKATNLYHPGNTIKIYEGKVVPGAGHSKSGNQVDSIYLKLEFSDDPGSVYEIKGHQRTGFFEDEY